MARNYTTGNSRDIHAEIIAGILEDFPSAKTHGYMKALLAIPEAEYLRDMHKHSRWWWNLSVIIPDAYLIDHGAREVIVFEAVVSHDVDRHKFGKLAEVAWALDEDYYDLVLMRCDRFGRTRYLPREASIVHCLENPDRDPDEDIVYVDDWHRYTAEYCEHRVPPILAGVKSSPFEPRPHPTSETIA